MTFWIADWLRAFAVTLACELAVAMPLLRGVEPNALRRATCIVIANLATHPIVWFVRSDPAGRRARCGDPDVSNETARVASRVRRRGSVFAALAGGGVMLLRALDIKLLRELSRQKGQIVSIALVLASGIASFIMLRGTTDALISARDAYYDRYRFAHVFAHLERAPESVAREVEGIEGVRSVQTRVAQAVLLPIERMLKPAYAQLLSLPGVGRPATNALHLDRGRFPQPGRPDEVVGLASFAAAHGLVPGHHVSAVLNGKLRSLRIVGLARSPEFIYATRPGALIADPKRCAVLWMERTALASAFDLEGSFNEISLRLQPGASPAEVRTQLDRVLTRYGGDGAYAREMQLSHRILTGELTIPGERSFAAVVPRAERGCGGGFRDRTARSGRCATARYENACRSRGTSGRVAVSTRTGGCAAGDRTNRARAGGARARAGGGARP